MNRKMLTKTLAAIVLLIALGLLAVSGKTEHKVYDQDEELAELGLLTFEHISDKQLVIDATFSGTKRVGDKLYTTYNRSVERGKRACPT